MTTPTQHTHSKDSRTIKQMIIVLFIVVVLALAVGLIFKLTGNNSDKDDLPNVTFSQKVDTEKIEVGKDVLIGSVTGGKINQKTDLLDRQGRRMPYRVNPAGTELFTKAGTLAYDKRYTLTVAVDPDENHSDTFPHRNAVTTMKPKNLTLASVDSPKKISTGSLLRVHFDEAISKRKKASKLMTVTDKKTNQPVAGAWRWDDEKNASFRPTDYWAADTSFRVDVNTFGVDLGDGLYGQRNTTSDFRTGDRWVTKISNKTKMMSIWRNNHKVRGSMPVSLGKPGHETPKGIYVVGEKNPSMIMDSSTYGVSSGPNAYRLKVDWATQISYNGIYIHAAPWSLAQQGSENTSHGCVNVSDDLGQWYQHTAPTGSIVEVTGTGGETLEASDGLGYWNQTIEEFASSGI